MPSNPSTPNRHGYPEVASGDYDAAAMVSDDEEAYLRDIIGGGTERQDSQDALNNSMAEVSVTSNFTEKFFPPSPSSKNERKSADPPMVQTPATPTPASPGHPAPPTQYVVNDPYNAYDDDISTIANDTYVAKYMAGDNNPNQLPPTPKTPHQQTAYHSGVQGPASPDQTDGASQPTHVYTYNKLPKQKTRFQTDQAESSTSEESGGNTTGGKMGKGDDDKSVFSFASYKRFRGGSGWSRRNYMLAVCMSLFLLAVIGGLGYTFLRLRAQGDEDVLDQRSQQAGQPNANGGLNNPLPGDGIGGGWTLRPTGNPEPTPAPTITRSNAPSPIGPSPRPTPAPTPRPTKLPTSNPSMTPTTSPTTPFPTTSATSSPTGSPAEVLRQLLLRISTGETMLLINIPGTPQNRAYEWLHQDPNFTNYLERRLVQRFALAVMYYSTTQPEDAQESMQTWMSYDSNECTWFNSWFENRLACGSDDIYKFLTLRNLNLVGTIPSELAFLSKLNSLTLSNNGLSGSIPKEFGEWDSLENLDLRGNYLTGRIPEFKNIPNIKNITMNWNWLEGNVPPSVTKLDQLLHLDLTENSLFGFMPDQMCTKGLETLAVDCDQVTCNCCTKCGSEETRAPVVLPPSLPTPPPTRPPTPPPTPLPTLPPTPPPTFFGQCVDAIQPTKNCYTFGEPLIINFRNCVPNGNDWVGIYPDNVLSGQHFNPSLWKWSCNSQACADLISRGTVIMDATATGGSQWPLAPGEYKAWLFRRGGDGGAYPAIVGTTKFIIRNGQC
ncbi:unnamed protein product [Cylindrotheca closterium]|uniref:L domain-like protein n=1 Tax=Cylindrotheca closterium TaxID=2856 RepID=A0AAD2FNY6_9STRA|nr:unnamed protein product [Cylindrotheca closterium]